MAVAPISGGDILGHFVLECTGVRILMDVQNLQWLVPTKSGLKKDNS